MRPVNRVKYAVEDIVNSKQVGWNVYVRAAAA